MVVHLGGFALGNTRLLAYTHSDWGTDMYEEEMALIDYSGDSDVIFSDEEEDEEDDMMTDESDWEDVDDGNDSVYSIPPTLTNLAAPGMTSHGAFSFYGGVVVSCACSMCVCIFCVLWMLLARTNTHIHCTPLIMLLYTFRPNNPPCLVPTTHTCLLPTTHTCLLQNHPHTGDPLLWGMDSSHDPRSTSVCHAGACFFRKGRTAHPALSHTFHKQAGDSMRLFRNAAGVWGGVGGRVVGGGLHVGWARQHLWFG